MADERRIPLILTGCGYVAAAAATCTLILYWFRPTKVMSFVPEQDMVRMFWVAAILAIISFGAAWYSQSVTYFRERNIRARARFDAEANKRDTKGAAAKPRSQGVGKR